MVEVPLLAKIISRKTHFSNKYVCVATVVEMQILAKIVFRKTLFSNYMCVSTVVELVGDSILSIVVTSSG